jgi:type 1 glutamine amidotransferase
MHTRSVVVFSRTTGYRHDSIAAGVRAIDELGRQHGFAVDVTESDEELVRRLDDAQAAIFLNTSGTVLGAPQKAAFERFVRAGGGFVGVHAACDTEYEWSFYGVLVGAYFRHHPPALQRALVRVTDAAHASTRALPQVWERRDEWYDFDANPRARPGVRVLAVVDERSYSGGTMGDDHPIAWCHEQAGGRAFYTGLGHSEEGFDEPLYRAHLGGGIRYAIGAS